MNWYRKIAFPVTEENPRELGLNYTDFGHDFNPTRLKPYILWYIDLDWDIHAKKISHKISTHDDWKFEERENLSLMNNSISQGRFDPQTHTATIGFIHPSNETIRETQKKVYQLLDMEFNNPAIINFNK